MMRFRAREEAMGEIICDNPNPICLIRVLMSLNLCDYVLGYVFYMHRYVCYALYAFPCLDVF